METETCLKRALKDLSNNIFENRLLSLKAEFLSRNQTTLLDLARLDLSNDE